MPSRVCCRGMDKSILTLPFWQDTRPNASVIAVWINPYPTKLGNIYTDDL